MNYVLTYEVLARPRRENLIRQRDRGIAVTGHLNVVLCLADTNFLI